MGILIKNNARSVLAADISASATSLTVADASAFPVIGVGTGDSFYLTIVQGDTIEIVKVTAISGSTLTVERAQDGTSASSFSSGDAIELRMNKAALDGRYVTSDTDGNGSHTYNIGTGATTSGVTSTINIGTSSSSGSTTAITLGSTNSTMTRSITANGPITFTGGTSKFTHFGNNTVVIATTNATSTATLEIRGWGGQAGTSNIQANGRLYIGQSATFGGGVQYIGDGTPSVSANLGGVSSQDNVLFYRRNSGTDYWTARYAYTSNDWLFRGNITAYASDERLKTNITPITNPLEKIVQLRGVEFDWRDNVEEKGFMPSMQHETGVIAQEVQAVIPDAAVPAPFDPEYLTVKHEKIIPLLIESVKELKAQIDLLENKLEGIG